MKPNHEKLAHIQAAAIKNISAKFGRPSLIIMDSNVVTTDRQIDIQAWLNRLIILRWSRIYTLWYP